MKVETKVAEKFATIPSDDVIQRAADALTANGITTHIVNTKEEAKTKPGSLMIASNSGSQLPSEAYASPHVIFVAGAQKIVKDIDEGFKRIYEHTLPLES